MSTPVGNELLVRADQAVAWLSLNRPEKRNALSAALVLRLRAAVAEAEADDRIRVMAIRGEGKDFCAGADLAEIERASTTSVGENLADAESLGELFLLMRRSRKPVVAVVHGRALAGGCGLATACDLVLAAASARFGYPEVKIGFVAAMVMAILRRNLGEKRAFELLALGESIDAAAAERLGLVNRVFEDADLDAGASEFMRLLASRSSTALGLAKRLLYGQDGRGFEAAIRAGAEVNAIARLTEDARAGIASFTGSRSKEV